ncbi:PLP-dependent aminotransferase family protein [Bradyrhizobium sp. 200]|uniref:aminotransferase class I/II-fold pyridoxal phosphate-dependent enzyme n=1 Tax=Bradyrhizobium sp. 200 TaxID=2782665 RepID=UPI001FFFBD1D|nr:PLP-dependent aminotransferase family protein [Bradyrhizobium sp. 200]UPJ47807.1 PLP-dependent aminotransferase family protein [Bradyrhizobium sp. 200]
MARKQISLMRAAPPYLPALSEALRKTWAAFAESDEDLVRDFRQRRDNRNEENRSAGVDWIGNRVRPAPAPHRILVTNGTMNSILLLTCSLVPPGNVLLTEELTVPQIYTLAKIASVEVQGVRIDKKGLIPDDFERKCRKHAPRAVYINCTVHNPTAYVTPTERRKEIAEIARKYGLQIIEDEAQALYLEDLPDSFATIAPDISWYLMGLSKYLSLDVRIAFVVAPSERLLANNLERLLQVSTWHPEPVMASVVTRWIRSGVAQSLLRSVRTEIRKRQAIVSELLSDIDGFRGSSGIHFWLPAPAGVDSEQFSRMIAEAGILVQPSKLYAGDCGARFEGIRPSVGDPVDFAEIRYAVEVIRDIYYLFWFGSVP